MAMTGATQDCTCPSSLAPEDPHFPVLKSRAWDSGVLRPASVYLSSLCLARPPVLVLTQLAPVSSQSTAWSMP